MVADLPRKHWFEPIIFKSSEGISVTILLRGLAYMESINSSINRQMIAAYFSLGWIAVVKPA
jgi:hypothetical protein